MNRLQKKCAIAASVCHGSLVGVLLFGAALMPAPPESNFKPITLYSPDKISDAMSQGGDPNVKAAVTPQPPAAPAAPQVKQETPPAKPTPEPPKPEPPKPEPVKVETPKAVHPLRKETPKIPEPKISKNTKPELDPKELTPVTPKVHHKIDLSNSSLVVRKADDQVKAQKEAQRQAQEAADAEANRRAKANAKLFASTMKNISGKLSSSTPLVAPESGPGGGGEVSVNYRDLIASKYYNAWNPPSVLNDDVQVVTASVTISKDGNVIRAHIVNASGNSLMDRSIEKVLDTVRYFEPFPRSSSDQQRTFTIQFNLKVLRQIG